MSTLLDSGKPFAPRESDYAAALHFLEESERKLLAEYVQGKEFASDETLMHEQEEADCMAFVVNGKLAVKKQTNFPGKHVLVAILESGSLVGELSVLDKGNRAATVDVLEPCRLLVLSSDDFNSLLDEKPRLGIKLLRRIIHVASIRVKKADDRLSRLL